MSPNQPTHRRTGGQLLVDQLLAEGIHLGFCVPGESYLPVLDALRQARDDFRLITCRHEATASHMAEASAKLTGVPGACFVTRGPGALQAAVGVHTAAQDSTPLLLFIGQVATRQRGREAFQEVDYETTFGSIAKWVVEIGRSDRIPDLVARACRVALSGRPGPVVVALPEDVLWAEAQAPLRQTQPARPAQPNVEDLDELRTMLLRAARPVALIGGPHWNADVKARFESLATESGLAVATTFRRQDYFDNRHANYVGNLGIPWNHRLADRIDQSDLILAIGTRLDAMTTRDNTLLDPEQAAARLVHVHPDVHVSGMGIPTRLGIAATALEFVPRLAELLTCLPRTEWTEWADAGHAEHRDWVTSAPTDNTVDLAQIVRTIRRHTTDDTIFTNGAGNYTGWVHRYLELREHGTQLAPLSGSMGYGIPAAIAACLVRPHARAVAFAGDGCFQMAAHELATAVASGAAPVVVLFNNGMLGTIRMHQDRHFPGRPYATSLDNPDFVALARSYGAHAEQVASTEDFEPAFLRARAAGRAAVIEVIVPGNQRSSPPA